MVTRPSRRIMPTVIKSVLKCFAVTARIFKLLSFLNYRSDRTQGFRQYMYTQAMARAVSIACFEIIPYCTDGGVQFIIEKICKGEETKSITTVVELSRFFFAE